MTEIAVAGSLLPGEHLDRYRLLAPLGQGEIGTLHLGVADGLGDFHKLVVLRELHQGLSQNVQLVRHFLQQANLATRLNHPNIVHTQEAGQANGRYFFAMEFLDGQPLDRVFQRLDHEPPITLEGGIQLLCEVLAGLQHAHQLTDYSGVPLNIVHQHVRPKSIFVTYEGQAKLLDFGSISPTDGDPTGTRLFTGDPGYAAPEQFQGREVNHQVDLFALGVILWELIAKRRFAPGPLTRQLMAARIAGTEPRIAELVPEVDRGLAATCDRALQPDPEYRFANAEEFRDELLDYLVSRSHRVARDGIAKIMRAKFVEERSVMHQLIRRSLTSHADMTHSGQRVITTPLFRDDVTEKVDLSEFIRAIQRPGLSRARNALRDHALVPLSNAGKTLSLTKMFLGIIAASVAVSLYLFSTTGTSTESAAPATITEPSASVPVPPITQPPAPQATPTLAPEPNEAPLGAGELDVESESEPSGPSRVTKSRSARASSHRSRPARSSSHRSRSTRHSALTDDPADERDRFLPADGQMNPASSIEAPSIEGQRAPASGSIHMGMDLEREPRSRSADFENPFDR